MGVDGLKHSNATSSFILSKRVRLTVTRANFLARYFSAYAAAGHAGIAQIDNEKDRLTWRQYFAPPSRLEGGNTRDCSQTTRHIS